MWGNPPPQPTFLLTQSATGTAPGAQFEGDDDWKLYVSAVNAQQSSLALLSQLIDSSCQNDLREEASYVPNARVAALAVVRSRISSQILQSHSEQLGASPEAPLRDANLSSRITSNAAAARDTYDDGTLTRVGGFTGGPDAATAQIQGLGAAAELFQPLSEIPCQPSTDAATSHTTISHSHSTQTHSHTLCVAHTQTHTPHTLCSQNRPESTLQHDVVRALNMGDIATVTEIIDRGDDTDGDGEGGLVASSNAGLLHLLDAHRRDRAALVAAFEQQQTASILELARLEREQQQLVDDLAREERRREELMASARASAARRRQSKAAITLQSLFRAVFSRKTRAEQARRASEEAARLALQEELDIEQQRRSIATARRDAECRHLADLEYQRAAAAELEAGRRVVLAAKLKETELAFAVRLRDELLTEQARVIEQQQQQKQQADAASLAAVRFEICARRRRRSAALCIQQWYSKTAAAAAGVVHHRTRPLAPRVEALRRMDDNAVARVEVATTATSLHTAWVIECDHEHSTAAADAHAHVNSTSIIDTDALDIEAARTSDINNCCTMSVTVIVRLQAAWRGRRIRLNPYYDYREVAATRRRLETEKRVEAAAQLAEIEENERVLRDATGKCLVPLQSRWRGVRLRRALSRARRRARRFHTGAPPNDDDDGVIWDHDDGSTDFLTDMHDFFDRVQQFLSDCEYAAAPVSEGEVGVGRGVPGSAVGDADIHNLVKVPPVPATGSSSSVSGSPESDLSPRVSSGSRDTVAESSRAVLRLSLPLPVNTTAEGTTAARDSSYERDAAANQGTMTAVLSSSRSESSADSSGTPIAQKGTARSAASTESARVPCDGEWSISDPRTRALMALREKRMTAGGRHGGSTRRLGFSGAVMRGGNP